MDIRVKKFSFGNKKKNKGKNIGLNRLIKKVGYQ